MKRLVSIAAWLLFAGALCAQTVLTPTAPSNLAVAPDTATYPNLQALGSAGWTVLYGTSCCGGSNSGTGTGAWGIASPSLSGGSMSLTNVYTGASGNGLNSQMYTTLDCSILSGGSCLSANNIKAEVHYYIPSTSAAPQAIEGPNVVLYDGTDQEYPSLQCDAVGAHWWVWNSGGATWVDTGNSCSAALTTNVWHDLVANYVVDGVAHTLGYASATLDGSSIGTLGQFYSGEADVTSLALKAQVQLDGNEAGASTTAVNYDKYDVTVTTSPRAATPTASPAAGTYTSAQTVTLSTSTSGATICYTTDGTTPTATTPGTCSHGTTYSSAISVSTTQTIQAIATESGYTNSGLLTAAYTISGSATATLILTPNGNQVGNNASSVPTSGITYNSVTIPYVLNFDDQGTNTASMPLTVGISNCSTSMFAACSGSGTATITGVSISGTNASDFALSGTSTGSLSAGQYLTPTITFTPTAASGTTESATLTVSCTGCVNPTYTLPLSGISTTETMLSSSSCPTALTTGNYQLTADISCPLIAFTFTGSPNVNLNGHTVTYGTTTSSSQAGAFDASGYSAGPLNVHNGYVTQGPGVNTFWDGQATGNGAATSSVFGGLPSTNNPYSSGWSLSNLTITFDTQYANAVIMNGTSPVILHDLLVNNNTVGTCATVGCRSEAQSYSFYQYNASGVSSNTLLMYNVTQQGGAQGGISFNSGYAIIAYNYLNPGNSAGINPNDFAVEDYGIYAQVEHNEIGTPYTAELSTRGIIVSGAAGYGSNNTVANNYIGAIEQAPSVEYGNTCEGGGTYGVQYDDKPPGPNTVENNTVQVLAKGCAASALRITDTETAANTGLNNTYISEHQSGFTACTFNVDTNSTGGCSIGTSMDGPTAYLDTNGTFEGDDTDVLFDGAGGSGVTFQSSTFKKPATASSSFHTFTAVTGTPAQGGGSVTNVHFIDPVYDAGTSPTDLNVPAQDPITPNMGAVTFYPADWTQTMQVNKASGPAASGAVVTWTDTKSNTYTCTTNSSGTCTVVLSQYQSGNMTAANQSISLNPYSLSVPLSGCTTYTQSGITISATGSKTVVLGGC